MNTIGLHTEDYDSYFKLMADIDLGGLGPQSFNMIGASPFYFRGVFDGNGHTISNFTYISTDIVDVGIFSVVFDPHAEIRDLGLINPIIDVESGIPYPEDRDQEKVELNSASSLVNFLGSGTIRRCYVQGGDISADLNVGGLIAYNHGGTIADCSSTATVDGINGIGGLIGYNRGVVTGCHATSTVAGNDGVGGLVGSNEGAIQNSSAVGDVTGDSGVGGLVGENRSHKTIQGSFSAGSVVGSRDVGGLVGFGRGDVIDCYSTCSVSGGQYVGGLVGYLDSATIDSCYSTGHIIYEPIEDLDRDPSIGGLVGFGLTPHENASSPPFEVLRSFWDIETSGYTTSFAGTGLTTAEMQTAGTFLEAGWDFVDETANGTDDLWWIAEGQGYPRLWWELGN
jgi:hypothetical protein